jgi:hypothetical protein
LQLLLPDFVDNGKELSNAVKNCQSSNEHFKEFPLQSDLYMAINNGIDLLKKQPADNTGIIVAVTAGLNIKASGASTEMETVRKNALDAGIPVYVIKYPVFGDTPEVNTLAESVHGLSFASGNAETALNELQSFYKNFNARSYGQDYKFTFTATVERDGKPHHIRMTIDRALQQIPPFVAPDMTIGLWIKENLWLFIALAAAFIGLIVLMVWLIRKKSASRDRKIAENEAKLQSGISASNQALEEIKKQQETKEQQRQAEAARKASEEEEERLARLMQTKNLFPRLQCKAGNSSFNFNINKPLTTIGRKGFNNDVELDSEKVSRHHAEIVFTGGGFEIIDKGSTNKVIVNGCFVQRAALKNGDIIGLGEAVITFYV